MFNAVRTSSVARINAGEVGRLDATGPEIAVAQYSIAVRPWYPLSSPRADSRVTVS